jgi:ubiquitin-activating enzyme E1
LDARLYLDAMCVRHRLPLVDVGTMGSLGSVQVVLPGLTESYSDSSDEETDLIPTCTIKSYPYKVRM